MQMSGWSRNSLGVCMLSHCANSDCHTDFDSRQGRYFRFHATPRQNGQTRNTHGVVHFWLCGRCSQIYSLGYVDGRGSILILRFEGGYANGHKPAAHLT